MDRKRQYSGNVSNFQVTINNPSSSDSDSDPDYAPRRGRQVHKRRRTDSCTTGSTTSGLSESDSTGSRHSVASVITVPPTSGLSVASSDTVDVIQQLSKELRSSQLVRLPPFWENAAEAWYARVEGTLLLSRITDEEAKCTQLVAQLDQKVARDITVFTTKPFYKGMWDDIKAEILRIHCDTKEQRVRRLLSGSSRTERASKFCETFATSSVMISNSTTPS